MIISKKNKLFTIASLIISLSLMGFTGCNTENEETKVMEKLEENKEIALGLSQAIMNGDWEKVDVLLADDFSYESDGRPAIGKAEYIGFMKGVLSSAMQDMDMDFIHVISEGNLVSVNYSNKMTHKGNFLGVPETGKRVIATGQFIREIKDGKVTAEWQTTNALGLMQQLGAIPSN